MPRAAAPPGRVVAVAYSGGRDSTALLHATIAGAAALATRVVALHVHHGLSAHADDWQAHCRKTCEGLGAPFFTERLGTSPPPGESIEAWARRARYAALRRLALAAQADTVLLAHHRRDQAETWLLQALRGGGLRGLAAMPRAVQREDITWLRPWLDVPDERIAAYVAQHGLEHIVDDSNADLRLARNRLRITVWPGLAAAFPDAEAVLATAAGWAQEADACLGELAALDLERLDAASPAGAAALHVKTWAAWSAPRRSNVLRAWLRRTWGHAAPSALVQRLAVELAGGGSAVWPAPGGELRRYRGLLRWQPATRGLPAGRQAPAETVLSIRRAGLHRLPGWGGSLRVQRVRSGGVPLAWLAQTELRERSGGERFQAGLGRPPRSLKKQFQSAGLAAWEREGPLLYSGGQLVFVPGLGLDARVIGLPGQPQVQLHWCPEGAPPSPAKIEG